MKRHVQAPLLALCVYSLAALLAGCEDGPTSPSPNSPPKPKTLLDAPSADIVPIRPAARV